MPRLIDAREEEAIALGDLVEMLEAAPFDPRDEDAFAAFGPALRGLANNPDFLAEIMIAELKARCDGQVQGNQYGPSVVMLHGPSNNCFVRANIWPADGDSIVRHSGHDPFFYHVPHDHNFSFLTVGYVGPGYWSDYYEFDYDRVAGHVGEKVDLRFVERARLDQGKVMLYRAHRDVHVQLPAEALSISLNIVEISGATSYRDQYRFDIEKGEVAGTLNRMSIEPLLAIAAHHGGGNGADLIDRFARSHPSDRVRFQAIRAKASAAGGVDARLAVFAEASGDPSRLVAEMAKREAARLEASRHWIERAPADAAA